MQLWQNIGNIIAGFSWDDLVARSETFTFRDYFIIGNCIVGLILCGICVWMHRDSESFWLGVALYLIITCLH